MPWATAMEIFRHIGTQLMGFMVYREDLSGTGLIRCVSEQSASAFYILVKHLKLS